MSMPDGLDRIDLTGVSVRGRHGVFEHERRDGQTFVVDVALGLDLSRAAADDDLAGTVDYGAVAQAVHDIVAGEPMDLIESLAQDVVDWCLALAPVRWASVTVHKPEAPIAVTFTDVSVTIERSKT